MTDAQLSKMRDMAQDGRLTMKDLAVVIADFLVFSEKRPGSKTKERLKSDLWYESQRYVADHPAKTPEPGVGTAVQTVWPQDAVK